MEPPYVPGDALHGRECISPAAGVIANECINSGIVMSRVPGGPWEAEVGPALVTGPLCFSTGHCSHRPDTVVGRLVPGSPTGTI